MLWRVAKKRPGSPATVSPLHPVGDRAATSFSVTQTCQPGAQRSATLHPAPAAFTPSSPAARLQAGVTVSLVARLGQAGARTGFSGLMPGMLQAPLHPAMFGNCARLVNPSRYHQAQPIADTSDVATLTSSSGAEVLSGSSAAPQAANRRPALTPMTVRPQTRQIARMTSSSPPPRLSTQKR